MIWKNVPENIEEFIGFVYSVTEKSSGMNYIGIKKFWKTIKMPPLKGKQNKRHKVVETDWKTYNTSSPLLQKKIERNPSNYEKTMLFWCRSVTDMKCWEAYIQLKHYVRGEWDLLFNEVINLRIRIRKKEPKK